MTLQEIKHAMQNQPFLKFLPLTQGSSLLYVQHKVISFVLVLYTCTLI